MRKLIIVTLVVFAAALLVAAAFFFRATLIVSTNLSTAALTVDNKTATSSGTFRLFPGTHHLSIEAEGFIPYEKDHRLGLGQRVEVSVELLAIPSPVQISEEGSKFLALSLDKTSVFFLSPTGQLLSRTKDAVKPLTPDGAFRDAASISFAPDQEVAIYKTPDGTTNLYDFKRYDLVAQEHFVYGQGIGAINWILPKGEKLVYYFAPGTGEKSLISANRTNGDPERILNLTESNLDDVTVATSPDGKKAVLVSRPGTEFTKYDLSLFDFFTKTVAPVTNDGQKIDATFSPGGLRILFTRFREDPGKVLNHSLSVMDDDGKSRQDFEIRATLSKIAFLDDNRLVVASPGNNGDRLLRLNLEDGTETLYYVKSDKPYYFGSLQLSSDRKTLFALASETDPKAESGIVVAIPLETSEY
jgi:hypothetical protein